MRSVNLTKMWLSGSKAASRPGDPWSRRQKRWDLVFAIENIYEETPDSLKRLLDEIQSPHFRFCFDTGHYHAFSKRKVPLSRWIETLGSYFGRFTSMTTIRKAMNISPWVKGVSISTNFLTSSLQFRLKPIFTIEPHQEEHLWRGMEAAKRYMNRCQIAGTNSIQISIKISEESPLKES